MQLVTCHVFEMCMHVESPYATYLLFYEADNCMAVYE